MNTSKNSAYRYCLGVTCAMALCITAASPLATADEPGVIFRNALPDVPGKQLVVVELKLPPRPASLPPNTGHRHPGSVWVYVTKGVIRLGIEGQAPKTVRTGESFFEPKGAVHNVMENVSTTEPAVAIAVMIVPEGAPLVQ